jgi:hypothetical protein
VLDLLPSTFSSLLPARFLLFISVQNNHFSESKRVEEVQAPKSLVSNKVIFLKRAKKKEYIYQQTY